MAKLTNLKPALSAIAPRLGYAPGDQHATDKQRTVTQPWRAWYKTARWQKLRQHVLLRDLYTCALCARIQLGKGAAVVDHIKPHRGNPDLFWDDANLQVLCFSPCHSQHKQAAEQAEPHGVWD